MKRFSIVGEFKILRKLPSLNDVVSANRSGYHVGASQKKKLEQDISAFIEAAVYSEKKLAPIDIPISVYCRWHESTKRRDADNVESSVKFILDAMQKCGIIKGDGRKYVQQVYHKIVEGNDDYVEVILLKEHDNVENHQNGDKINN